MCVLGSVALIQGLSFAAVEDNPYHSIVDRNVFDLKPPPPPPPVEQPKPVTPPSTVRLTGITTILGPKLALFMVKSQEPPAAGKPAGPPKEKSVMLKEGAREGDLEVVEINVKENTVKIKIDGVESTVTFEKNPLAGAGPPGGGMPGGAPAGVPGGGPHGGFPGAPQNGGPARMPNFIPAPQAPGRNFGGANYGAPNAGGGANYGAASYGGATPSAAYAGGVDPNAAANSLNTALNAIPDRQLRTPQAPPQPVDNLDAAQKMLLLEANRAMQANQNNPNPPPLPPPAPGIAALLGQQAQNAPAETPAPTVAPNIPSYTPTIVPLPGRR